ncbi:MAG: mechanosensitive ion channel family protein [Aurantimonas endophytica]|uniref:Small-conductance mechanosensitive channel n=1 Tax=Aurantimonas endophytica TaxID=1522175 RepID=A0A7W6HGM2_9HYPH|nr:mechanosensitive ion channel family protein [Aurantimonas endophytica]MBB4004885.1 small-conductance mechanosensitive channel [Aurantimonas endophytica]
MTRWLAAFLILLATLSGANAQDSGGGSPRFLEIETLNSGLPPADRYIDRDTPQGMMETFILAAEREDWDTAAHMLDLSGVDPAIQPEMGPALAARLNEIIEGAMWLDWGDLPDRPDALADNVASENPLAGEPRRNIRLAILELPDRPVSIRIARVKPADGDPVWVFSEQTVGNILALHEVFGPTRFEEALPQFLQERAFWTLAWWEVIALPLVLLLAVGAAALAYAGMGRAKRNQPSQIAENIVDTIQMPVALMVCVGTFSLVKSWLFTFSGAVNIFLAPLQSALFIIALALIAVRIVDAVLDRVVRRNMEELSESEAADQRNLYTNISAARRVAIVLAFLVGTSLVLIQTNAFETLGFSMLASAGAIGLILAFAARSVLADIMASLQIALAKTARIGDAVLYKGQWCYVEKINFTYVQLKSWDNRRIIVPVSELVSNSFENWTKQDPSLIKSVELRLDHRADVDRLREAFQKFIDESDDVIDKDSAKVQVIGQDATGILVWFLASAEDPSTGWAMECRLRETMLKEVARLDAETGNGPVEGTPFLPREREMIVGGIDPA